MHKSPTAPRITTPTTTAIKHLLSLLRHMRRNNEGDELAVTVAVFAFWGMARLGELVPLRSTRIITLGDVEWTKNRGSMRLTLGEAKTSKPGKVQ